MVDKIIRMWAEEPTLTTKDSLRSTATLVLVGDDDMPALGDTVDMYEPPRGQLAVVSAGPAKEAARDRSAMQVPR